MSLTGSNFRKQPTFFEIAAVFAALSMGCNPPATKPSPELEPSHPSPDVVEPEVVTQTVPPPPISGGTMLVSRSSQLVIAGDPDRDRIWVVSPAQPYSVPGEVVFEIVLPPGDLPGRLVEDGAGNIHVVFRRAGVIATIDSTLWQITDRRSVCPSPFGLAYDAAEDTLLVACTNGELVTLPASGGAEIKRFHIDDDLRDVVADKDRIVVSRFRSAEILLLDKEGTVTDRYLPPTEPDHTPAVAWRMAPIQGGGAVIVHQVANLSLPVSTMTTPAPYYTGVDPILTGAISLLPPADSGVIGLVSVGKVIGALPVDIAISDDYDEIAVAGAGSWSKSIFTGPKLGKNAWTGELDWASQSADEFFTECVEGYHCEPVSVAISPYGRVFLQSREPPIIAGVALPAESRFDSGHNLFHTAPRTGIACASCHPEGREDGLVWNFGEGNLRRTQSVAGGISQTAPFHWKGDVEDMNALMNLVFVERMGGKDPGPNHIDALIGWLDTVSAPASNNAIDEDAAARGALLFSDAEVGCATCHSGPQFTNNQTVDVGTGGVFQVPRLTGVGSRAPYMHDGCAKTLMERFTVCGGGDKHGRTSQLNESELADLVAYLNTL